jgi:hypothetical protein
MFDFNKQGQLIIPQPSIRGMLKGIFQVEQQDGHFIITEKDTGEFISSGATEEEAWLEAEQVATTK